MCDLKVCMPGSLTSSLGSSTKRNIHTGEAEAVVQLLIRRLCSGCPFGAQREKPSLIELSGSSSQHEDALSIHAGWDASIVQEIIDNYIMCQV